MEDYAFSHDYIDFETLRAKMGILQSGHVLFVLDAKFSPDEIRELDSDSRFIVVAGMPHGDSETQFHCIARVGDTKLAFDTIKSLITSVGGTNIQTVKMQ